MYILPPIPLKEHQFLDGWKKWLKRLDDAFHYIQNNGLETSGDLFVNDSTNGLILTSPDGNYWLIQISNAGALTINGITAAEVGERFRRGRS